LKKISAQITVILLFVLIIISVCEAAPVLYNLPVFNIETEKDNMIDLNSYFLVKPDELEKIEFGTYDKKIISDIKFDKDLLRIIISAGADAGITRIPLILKTRTGSDNLSMFVKTGKSKYPQTFKYSGSKGMKVSVAGDFNGWNKNSNVMIENNGEYQTTMILKPGIYKYKFVINDNEWITDSGNPVKSTDGYNNSVINVGSEKDIKYNIIAVNKNVEKDNSVKFEFIAEINNSDKINSEIYFLSGNKLISYNSDFKSGKIAVVVPKEIIELSNQNELNNEIYKITAVIVTGTTNYFCKSYAINSF